MPLLHLVIGSGHFKGIYCLRLQGSRDPERMPQLGRNRKYIDLWRWRCSVLWNISVTLLITLRGGVQNWPWVLGTLFYKGIKIERGENWSHKTQIFRFLFYVYVLFAIIQFSNQKTLPRMKKYGEGASAPPCRPPPSTNLRLCFETSRVNYPVTGRLIAEGRGPQPCSLQNLNTLRSWNV
jgi:hypothetical protein